MEPNFADKTIWTGDNLDILRGMNSESVDLIYLDPPFNSNRNYSAPVGSAANMVGSAAYQVQTLAMDKGLGNEDQYAAIKVAEETAGVEVRGDD